MNYKIKAITAAQEKAFLFQYHYSKKSVPNSCVRLGAFDGTKLMGVVSFGKIINCVPLFTSTDNRCGLEVNRLAMRDEAPKNSESWFLMRSIHLISKKYTWLRFISTWADGLRCQGGTIYKACGFYYMRKRPLSGIYRLPDGSTLHTLAFRVYKQRYSSMLSGVTSEIEKVRRIFGPECVELGGAFQYNYVYLLDKSLKADMVFPPQPYEANARVPSGGQTPAFQAGKRGSTPTHPLQETLQHNPNASI